MQQSWHILHSTLGDMPRSEIGFQLLLLQSFFRSKHSVGRQSTRSNCGSTLSAVVMLYSAGANTLTGDMMFYQFAEILCRPSRYSILQKKALCRASRCFLQLRKYYVGRRNVLSNCGNTLSAVRVPYPVEASILSAVIMLSPTAEILCRASRCSIL